MYLVRLEAEVGADLGLLVLAAVLVVLLVNALPVEVDHGPAKLRRVEMRLESDEFGITDIALEYPDLMRFLSKCCTRICSP